MAHEEVSGNGGAGGTGQVALEGSTYGFVNSSLFTLTVTTRGITVGEFTASTIQADIGPTAPSSAFQVLAFRDADEEITLSSDDVNLVGSSRPCAVDLSRPLEKGSRPIFQTHTYSFLEH
eukprot:1188252-Prorocentrum_minimum.AAC.2